MKPGDHAQLSDKNDFDIKTVNPETYSSWRNDILVFEDMPLEEIGQIIEDNYGYRVTIVDESLKKMRVNTNLSQGDVEKFCNEKHEGKDAYQGANHTESLKVLLNKLEEQHDIFINYESKIVDGIDVNSLDADKILRVPQGNIEELESSVTELLNSHKLDFMRFEANNYIIVKKAEAPKSLKPLPGVNILAQGTTLGTVTDIDGNYTISVPDETRVLVFSSVGYLTEEVNIGERSIINVQLAPDIQSLTEIVVIGYGTQERRDLTGSVSSVKSEDIVKLPNVNVQQSLQGRAPGVVVTENSGRPGAAATVQIRGVGTVGNSDPLYVVDGQILNGANGIESLNTDHQLTPWLKIGESLQMSRANEVAIGGTGAFNSVFESGWRMAPTIDPERFPDGSWNGPSRPGEPFNFSTFSPSQFVEEWDELGKHRKKGFSMYLAISDLKLRGSWGKLGNDQIGLYTDEYRHALPTPDQLAVQ